MEGEGSRGRREGGGLLPGHPCVWPQEAGLRFERVLGCLIREPGPSCWLELGVQESGGPWTGVELRTVLS